MSEQATAAAGAGCMPHTSTVRTLCSVKQAAARKASYVLACMLLAIYMYLLVG
jgi:hypothetical protein